MCTLTTVPPSLYVFTHNVHKNAYIFRHFGCASDLELALRIIRQFKAELARQPQYEGMNYLGR